MKKHLLLLLLVISSIGVQAQWNNVTTTNNLICGSSPATGKLSNVSTSDGAGGMIIGWIDSRDSNSKSIYVQRILSDGKLKFIQEILVNNVAGAYSSVKSNLTIVSDSAGGAILVWQDARNTTSTNSNSDLFGQRIDGNGNVLWSKNGVRLSLADNSKSNKGAAQPVLVNKNEFVLIFNDNKNGTFDFYAQKVSLKDGSLLWASDVSLHGSKPFVQTQAIALSDGKGGAFVVWQDPRVATTNADIYGQYLDNSGKLLWDTAGLAICTAQNQQLTPQLTSDGTGGIIVVWSDQRATVADGNIYAQRINASGAIQWTKDGVLICDYSGNQAVPNIIKGGNGFIVAWSDARKGSSDRNIYAQSIDLTGAAKWTAVTAGGVPVTQAVGSQPINYTNSQNIKIFTDGKNGAYLIWDDSRNTTANIDIYAQRITSTGTVSIGWLADGNIISNAPNNQQSLSALVDTSYNLIVEWNDNRDSTNKIYASKVSPDGSLVLPIYFVNASARIKNNAVSIDWKITQQLSIGRFTIEYSTNGIDFSPIGTENFSVLNSYAFVHNRPTTGNNYYRIRVTNELGDTYYSSILMITLSNNSSSNVLAYPNPFINSLSLSFTNLIKGVYTISVINAQGKEVVQTRMNLEGSNSFDFKETNKLTRGSYWLKIVDAQGNMISSKLIIKQ